MPIPAKLYKYRSLNGEARKFTENIFKGNAFWYGRGSTFNDPFDCNFDLRTEKTDEELAATLGAGLDQAAAGIRNLLSRPAGQFAAFVRSRQESGGGVTAQPNAPVSRLLEKLDALAKPAEPAAKKTEWEFNVKVEGATKSLAEAINPIEARSAEKLKQSLDESFGVLCLSERPDDILLWSHYSDEHKGICLEFDTAGHADAFPRLAPVRYADDYPDLVKGFHNLLRLFRERTDLLLDMAALFRSRDPAEQTPAELCVDNWFYQKSTCWSSEREWRALVEKPGLKVFPAAALSGVVVGCKTPDKDIEDVRRWVKGRRRKVKLYRAVRRPTQFALNILPLD